MRAPVALAVLLLVAACGESVGRDILAPPVAPTPSASPVSRTAACPALQAEHLPGDTGTVRRAYVCTTGFRAVPGDGEWEFAVVQEITGGLTELVDTYARADAAPGGNCTADLPNPRVVYLHSDRVAAARAPHTSCGKPTPEAMAAFEALTLVEVAATKVRQVTTELARTTGCSDMWKDMLAIDEPSSTTARPEAVPASVLACTYRVEGSGQDRVGRLTRGRTLDAPTVQALNSALARAVPDPGCPRDDHTTFALVIPRSGSPATYVALDGCAVQQDRGWWRAGDDVRAALS